MFFSEDRPKNNSFSGWTSSLDIFPNELNHHNFLHHKPVDRSLAVLHLFAVPLYPFVSDHQFYILDGTGADITLSNPEPMLMESLIIPLSSHLSVLN